MDRRVKKSRAAIYQAFINLLNQKSYEKITVQEIIDLADVGRSTFYAHFETKEFLIEEICQDLFKHTFLESETSGQVSEIIAHIFYHFKKNQDKVATLLLSKNDYFRRRLKIELEHYLFPLVEQDFLQTKEQLPTAFLKHFVVTSFVETLIWWLEGKTALDEHQITDYFLTLMD